MQAYYEMETQVTSNHKLNIQLPESIPEGRVKITVVYEVAELPANKIALMAEFLASLPDHPEGGLSQDEILAYVNQERSSWDN